MHHKASGRGPKRANTAKARAAKPVPAISLPADANDKWVALVRMVIAALTALRENRLAEELSEMTGLASESPERRKLSRAAHAGDWDAVQDLLGEMHVLDLPRARFLVELQRTKEFVAAGEAVEAANRIRDLDFGAAETAELCEILTRKVSETVYSSEERMKVCNSLRSLLPASALVDPQRLREMVSAAASMRALRKAGHLKRAKGGAKVVQVSDGGVRDYISEVFAALGFAGGPRLRPRPLPRPLVTVRGLAQTGRWEHALKVLVRSHSRSFKSSAEFLAVLEAVLSSAVEAEPDKERAYTLLRTYGANLSSEAVESISESILTSKPSNTWTKYLGKHVLEVYDDALEYEALVDPYAQGVASDPYVAPDTAYHRSKFPGKCSLAFPFGSPVWIAEPSPDGKYLAVTSRCRTVLTVFAMEPEPHKLWECPTEHSRLYSVSIAWHPTKPLLAVGLSIMWVFVWNVASREPIACFRPDSSKDSSKSPSVDELEEDGVGALLWVPGEPLRLLCGWLDGTLELREFKDLNSRPVRLWSFPGSLRARALTWQTDQYVMALGANAGGEQQLVVIDASTWESASVATFNLKNDQVSTLALPLCGRDTPDGPRHAAVMTSEDGLVIFDRKGKQQPLQLRGPVQRAFVVPVRFSGYKDKFVLAGTESRHRSQYGYVFNRYTGERVAKLKGHTSMVNSISWVHNYIVTTSDDGLLRFYSC